MSTEKTPPTAPVDAVVSTPGPWKIIHGGFVSDDGFSIGSDNAAASRVKVVCECWPCTIVDQRHRDELLANAKLIAAAPALAEALRELHDFAVTDPHYRYGDRSLNAFNAAAELLKRVGF